MLKYPRTPYWPSSPAIAKDGRYIKDTSPFINSPIIITEKLDGSNTMLREGEVYGRGDSEPSHKGWRAMVRKHHSWRTMTSKKLKEVAIYGEDIYAVHSIEYAPVEEDATFYAFAIRMTTKDIFLGWNAMVNILSSVRINTVPVLFMGEFEHIDNLNDFLYYEHNQPSMLGGEREGMVIRTLDSFYVKDFDKNIVKSVRANHVQTNKHWTKNWRPCKIIR